MNFQDGLDILLDVAKHVKAIGRQTFISRALAPALN